MIVGLVVLIVLILVSIVVVNSRNSSTQSGDQTTGVSVIPDDNPSFLERLFGGKKSTPNEEDTDRKLSFKEIADKTTAWLLKQQDSRNKYYFGEVCTSPTTCEDSVEDNRVGISAIWGLFKSYEKTNDKKTLEIINKNLEAYTNPNVVPFIQNNFWNCKLMYEMSQSRVFDENRKSKVKDICFNSQHRLIREEELGTDTIQQTMERTEQLLDRTINNSVSTLEATSTSKEEDFINYSTAASDHIYKYLWNNQEYDYKFAYIYFNKALRMFNAPDNDMEKLSPLLGIAALDFYKKEQKEVYLSFAKHVYDKVPHDTCDQIDYCVNSIYLARELSNVTKDTNYKTQADNLTKYMIDHYFDYKNFGGYKFGKGSFYYPGTNAMYPVMYNGLIINLLYAL